MKNGKSPARRIREHCMDCCGGSRMEVRYCPLTDCPLWPFRFGRKPEAVIRSEGKAGGELFDESCFAVGGKFDFGKSVSEIEG